MTVNPKVTDPEEREWLEKQGKAQDCSVCEHSGYYADPPYKCKHQKDIENEGLNINAVMDGLYECKYYSKITIN